VEDSAALAIYVVVLWVSFSFIWFQSCSLIELINFSCQVQLGDMLGYMLSGLVCSPFIFKIMSYTFCIKQEESWTNHRL
jgi:hypothetical protein